MAATITIHLPNGEEYSQPTALFIDNDFVAGTGDTFDVVNPV